VRQWSVHRSEHVHMHQRLDGPHVQHPILFPELCEWRVMHERIHMHVRQRLVWKLLHHLCLHGRLQQRCLRGSKHVLVQLRLVWQHVQYSHLLLHLP
jgi:hypothetical protein